MKKYSVKEINNFPSYSILTLSPRSAADILNFRGGQYGAISFNRGKKVSPSRCFSFVSAHDGLGELRFGLRTEGQFTKAVSLLRAGDTVNVEGPFGDFTIDYSRDSDVVMIAGGIGITPFVSMLREALIHGVKTRFTLIYSCHDYNDVPFYKELRELEKKLPNLRVIYAISNAPNATSNPVIYPGRISQELLSSVTGNNIASQTFYMCGPSGFMKSIAKQLILIGVSNNMIKTESFSQAKKRKGVKISPSLLTYAAIASILLFITGIILLYDVAKNVTESDQEDSTSLQSVGASTDLNRSNDTTTSTSQTQVAPTSTSQSQTTNRMPRTSVS